MLIIHSVTGKFIVQPAVAIRDIAPFFYRRDEQPILPVQFSDDNGVIQFPDGTEIAMSFWQDGGGVQLATCAPTLSGTDADAVYTFSPALNTIEINVALDGKKSIPALMRVTWQLPGQDPIFAVKYGQIGAKLSTGTATTPNPGELVVFTSPGGKQFRFSFNDDETFDVVRIL